MLEHLIVVSLCGVLAGWVIAGPSTLLDPVLVPFKERVLCKEVTLPASQFHSTQPRYALCEWLLHKLECPVCAGFEATVVAELALSGWNGWSSVAMIGAANGAHAAWMSWLSMRQGD